MTRNQRLYWCILLKVLPIGSKKIADLVRKHKLFGCVGDNCHIQMRELPLYSELIFIHNNVCIGSNVHFCTHDASFLMLNTKYGRTDLMEKIGCIEIMDNVFIGSGTRIVNNVRIGSNVIIGAGSHINRDIPDNSVYSGNPAKFICSFDDYVDSIVDYTDQFKSKYEIEKLNGVNRDLSNKLYEDFSNRKKKKS